MAKAKRLMAKVRGAKLQNAFAAWKVRQQYRMRKSHGAELPPAPSVWRGEFLSCDTYLVETVVPAFCVWMLFAHMNNTPCACSCSGAARV